jgi:hypothetical protein
MRIIVLRREIRRGKLKSRKQLEDHHHYWGQARARKMMISMISNLERDLEGYARRRKMIRTMSLSSLIRRDRILK